MIKSIPGPKRTARQSATTMRRRQPPRRHACSRCVQLKVRCNIAEHGNACERCARLQKQCDFPDGISTSRVRSRASRLPEQVDHLEELNRQRDVSTAQTLPNPSVAGSEANQSSLTAATAPEDQAECRPYDPVQGGLISLQEADGLLDKFRICKMRQFPFVMISQDETASTLRGTYPFLFLAIITVCTEDDLSLYHRLEQEINKCVYGIMNNWRELDLVLGLLVHVAWSHYKWRTVPNQQYLLLQIAATILVDLRLDKGGYYGQDDFRPTSHPPDDRYKESLAGKRALLGYYYLFSMWVSSKEYQPYNKSADNWDLLSNFRSSLFRRQMFMRYTNWTEECCNILIKEQEFPSDALLKTYIDIQLLTHKGEGAFATACGSCANCTENFNFDAVHRRQSEIIRDYGSYESLQGALYLHLSAMPTLVLGQALRYQRDVFKREKHQLQTLLQSAHDLLESFLEIPLDVIVHLPSCSIATVWYCLLTISKLSLLPNEDWCDNLELDHEVSGNLAHAVLQRFVTLSKGEDIWVHCEHVVGGMLSLLGRTKAEKRRNQTGTRLELPPPTSVSAPLYHTAGASTNQQAIQQTDQRTTTAPLLQQDPTDITTQAALSSSLDHRGGLFQPLGMPTTTNGHMDGPSTYAASAADAGPVNNWREQLPLDDTIIAAAETAMPDFRPSELISDPMNDFWLSIYEKLLREFSPSPRESQMDEPGRSASGMFG